MTEQLDDAANPAAVGPSPTPDGPDPAPAAVGPSPTPDGPDPAPAEAADATPEAEVAPVMAAATGPITTADTGPITTEAVDATPPSAADPAPITGTPDRAYLVPLDELAPAIAAASTSRRAFLGFGLAIAGGVVGAAVISRFIPIFDDASDAASPIAGTYDPASKQWTFVVDTAACIGCGLCVVACKEENNVPEETGYTRTWVERHTVTTDGDAVRGLAERGHRRLPARVHRPGRRRQARRRPRTSSRACACSASTRRARRSARSAPPTTPRTA